MEIILPLFIIAAAVWALARKNEERQNARDEKTINRAYETFLGVWIVRSNHPGDPTVCQRAFEIKNRLIKSGNPYAEMIPVIEYPFHLARQEHGILTTWTEYEVQAFNKFQTEMTVFSQKMKDQNHPAYQTEFNGQHIKFS